MKKTVLLSFFIILILVYTSYGADYYVNYKTGSNSNSGNSEESAWKTISYAVAHVNPGVKSPATINQNTTPYRKPLRLKRACEPSSSKTPPLRQCVTSHS